MKFFLPFLSFGMAAATLPIFGKPSARAPVKLTELKADSSLGQKVLGKARKLEAEEEFDFTWVADYSIKFQGCHHISQWNEEADGEDDVRIQTKRLIRFRLCPTDSCTAFSAGGCSSNYGDYIIDMNEFLEVYYEAVDQRHEYDCEYYMTYTCDCDDDDGKGDDFDAEICEYDCFMEAGMDYCVDKNPYADDEAQEEEKFDLAEYVECKNVEFDNDNNRRLEEEEEIQYFVGPYCSEQGGAIYLGLFTDETCTQFADSYGGTAVYKENMGVALPYSSTSVITMDCYSCKEPAEINDDDGNQNGDAQDADEVVEMCEMIYNKAGKCEKNMPYEIVGEYENDNACTYIQGIKTVRNNGIVSTSGSKANKTASVFIGIFVVAFVLLAAYVYYLKTKLDRASINLSD